MAEPTFPRVRWAVMGVALGLALVIGAGVFSTAPTTNAAKAQAIDAQLKAPDSTGLSVAQATSAGAAAVRADVRAQVDMGRSKDEIIASLTARYGTAVLLTPPSGGLSTLLWLVPALLLVAIVASSVAVARRRRLPRAGANV